MPSPPSSTGRKAVKASSLRLDSPPVLPEPPVIGAELEARLLAFASPAVLKALQAASAAGLKLSGLYSTWNAIAGQKREASELRAQGIPQPDSAPGALREAREAVMGALREANSADDALIETIRVDLHGETGRALRLLSPPSPGQGSSQPPEHPGS